MLNRTIHIVILLLVPFFVYSQDSYTKARFRDIPWNILLRIDEMGTNEESMLNQLEGDFFNIILGLDKEQFDMRHKRVIFFTGSLGRVPSTKKQFFLRQKYVFSHGGEPIFGFLYCFDEKHATDVGYDAAFVFESMNKPSRSSVYRTVKRLVSRAHGRRFCWEWDTAQRGGINKLPFQSPCATF